MVLLRLIGYLLIGRALIFVGQKFPIHRLSLIGKQVREFLTDLFECDLCLGVYVYSLLSVLTGVNLVDELFGKKSWLFGNFITGAVASFLTHVFRIGWETKFSITAVFQQPEE